MIRALAHICFRTGQFEAMTGFYRNGLGLPIKFSLRLPDERVVGHYFELGRDSFLELFDQAGAAEMWGGSSIPPKVQPNQTWQHFCLEINSLEAFREKLLAGGIEVGDISTGLDYARQCWIKDPDGNDIELMEYSSDSLQLQTISRA